MISQIISYKIEPGDPAPEICRQILKLKYFKIFGHTNFRVDYVPAHWFPAATGDSIKIMCPASLRRVLP